MSEEELHRSIKRQLKKNNLEVGTSTGSEDFDNFVAAINRLLHQADETRYTLERSMEISSTEMRELYRDLKDKSEALLQSEQSKLESVIDSIDHGICAFSKTGKLLFINKSALEMLGQRPENGFELTRRITAFDDNSQQLKSRTLTRRAFLGERLVDYAGILQCAGNGSKDVSVSLNPLRSQEGSVEGVVLTIQDLTEHKQTMKDLAAALQNANSAAEAKGTFLATMSHEIRTPLNGVTGMLELLLTSELNKQQREFAEIAKNSGDTLLDVINDILDFSKIEAGQVELERVEFSPIKLAEDVARSLSAKASINSTILTTYASDRVPELCSGDLGRIRQVLLNLVGNAVKFTSGGEVQITISLINNQYTYDEIKRTIEFKISDNGIGIPQSRLENLFTPFSQVDASTTRKYGGTGLGLAISKELVDLMKGELKVTSEVDQGTTFSFNVPISVVHKRESLIEKVSRVNPGLKVLVVDDNATNRVIVRNYLERINCEITEANDGRQALELMDFENAAYQKYDLVITDALMNHIDGLELVKNIKADRRLRHIKIIALSSIPQTSDEFKELTELCDESLLKPIRQNSLVEAVERCFSTSTEIVGTEQKQTKKNNARLNLLVAEDSPTNQIVIKTLLKELGHDCEIVENGKLAVEAVNSKNYDAVLMDCMMPTLDGYEASKEIRNSKNEIHIIALTANALAGDKQKCLEAGMNDYVSKPITMKALQTALEKIEVANSESELGLQTL